MDTLSNNRRQLGEAVRERSVHRARQVGDVAEPSDSGCCGTASTTSDCHRRNLAQEEFVIFSMSRPLALDLGTPLGLSPAESFGLPPSSEISPAIIDTSHTHIPLDSVVWYKMYSALRGATPMESLSIGHVARKAGVGVETVPFSVSCSTLPFRNPGDAQSVCVRHER